jgi:hypothetical protein
MLIGLGMAHPEQLGFGFEHIQEEKETAHLPSGIEDGIRRSAETLRSSAWKGTSEQSGQVSGRCCECLRDAAFGSRGRRSRLLCSPRVPVAESGRQRQRDLFRNRTAWEDRALRLY